MVLKNLTILQNAFSNSASSIGQSKFQGNIVDVLMAPLNSFDLATGYIFGSVTRGIVCGIVTYFGVIIFVPLSVYSYLALIYFTFMGSFMMACLGTLVGVWADKWDQQQGIENFIVLPLTFLSGTFYSISILPEFWRNLSFFNPFFYNIDGFRYAFTGQSEASIYFGGMLMLFINSFLFLICYTFFYSGYKLKS